MGALTILVTGAGGFIGREVVETALARGHGVRALVRRNCSDFAGIDGLECIAFDLADDAGALDNALRGVDAVIHCAAAMGGDDAAMQRDTVAPTRALVRALKAANPQTRLVLLSSIAVYAPDALPEMATIDENTPLEEFPEGRDAYTRAKLAQEAAVRGSGLSGWIARPGAVYGPDRVWNAHLGPKIGPVLLRLGREGQIPLISVAGCAEALVRAAETPPPVRGMRAVNLVDDDLPDRERFLLALGRTAPGLIVPVDWRLFDRLAGLFTRFPGLARRMPGLLRPGQLRARMRPATYSNARARAELKWHSAQPFENAMRSALRGRA